MDHARATARQRRRRRKYFCTVVINDYEIVTRPIKSGKRFIAEPKLKDLFPGWVEAEGGTKRQAARRFYRKHHEQIVKLKLRGLIP